jgi:hypothetical protein
MRYNQAMITLLLGFHIVLLSLSILMTIATLLTSALGHVVPKIAILLNTIGTTIGLSLGVVLLLSAPLDAKCITLAMYLVVFSGAQVYITSRNQRLAVSSDS